MDSHEREKKGENRRSRFKKKKKMIGVKERGMKRKDGRGSRILFHAAIIMKSFHSVCDDEGFLSSSYVKPLDGFDANIISHTFWLPFSRCD